MPNPEQALWRAVIDQAIADASGKGALKVTPLERDRALNWLFKPNRDFARVCALADLEPDCVRAQARKTIDEQTRKPQRKRNRLYEFNGRAQGISAWATEIGCTYALLYQRLVTHSWTPERALTTPFDRNV